MSESTFKRDVIKISLLGNQSVGKTTIRNVFLKLDFNENSLSTVGINKTDSIIKLDDGNELKLVIWDTAGQERFHSISLSTVKNSQGVILVYDVTNRQSFIDLNIWLDEINRECSRRRSSFRPLPVRSPSRSHGGRPRRVRQEVGRCRLSHRASASQRSV